jgi:hypothetical protein
MSLARVQFFSISLDGFGTGEGQSLDAPFGHAGERLHEWMFVTRWWGEMVGQAGGTGGVDDAFLRLDRFGWEWDSWLYAGSEAYRPLRSAVASRPMRCSLR